MRLNEEMRTRLAAYAATARWPAGFAVYQRGAAADGIFVVLSGSVVLRTRLKSGRAFVPALLTAGEVFGVEGLAPGAAYQTDASAESEAQTLHLSRLRLRTLMRERPEEALALVAQVADAHGIVLDRLRELAMMSVEQRLLGAVARMRAARADTPPDEPIVFDAAGYRLLCEMVGATRESVSLVVNRLVTSGQASRDGANVAIKPTAGRRGGRGAAEDEDDDRTDRERPLASSNEGPRAG